MIFDFILKSKVEFNRTKQQSCIKSFEIQSVFQIISMIITLINFIYF